MWYLIYSGICLENHDDYYNSWRRSFLYVWQAAIIANRKILQSLPLVIVPIIFSNNLKLWCHYFDWHAQVVSEGLFTRTMALALLIDSDRIARQCLSVYRRTYHKYLMTDWYWIMQQKFQVFSFDWNVVSIEVWLEFGSKQTGDHYIAHIQYAPISSSNLTMKIWSGRWLLPKKGVNMERPCGPSNAPDGRLNFGTFVHFINFY